MFPLIGGWLRMMWPLYSLGLTMTGHPAFEMVYVMYFLWSGKGLTFSITPNRCDR
jgi:hypothetical protein